ncbi:Universal stress protein Sll1388 [Planktothrix tepida]|uniref:UspA domain-containing protein n=1 Tax=Planktothrix tepida PCC 9214 TaxID=671072 RepID=A0A1J1LIK9_9CYAN|nr:universal stress protein [Planktothrix tepida]CAD5983008.1 Universal stress protein Sll1388 [Planktothrix tepida]CUR32352.1 conserved hypothetical protein [Planktothrix tepida PCC 9214]
MNYQRILVAIDQSVQSKMVFETALELARKSSGQLMIFHRLSLDEPESYTYTSVQVEKIVHHYKFVQEKLEQDLEKVRLWLTGLENRAIEAGIQAEWDWKEGNAGRLICQVAKNWNADIIVMGRRGKSAVMETLLGSVSYHVVHHAPCAVLIVQGK